MLWLYSAWGMNDKIWDGIKLALPRPRLILYYEYAHCARYRAYKYQYKEDGSDPFDDKIEHSLCFENAVSLFHLIGDEARLYDESDKDAGEECYDRHQHAIACEVHNIQYGHLHPAYEAERAEPKGGWDAESQ